MKTIKYICFAIVTILLVGLFSFNPKNQLLPTKLKVTIIDEIGNVVEGATVTIYENEDDYRENEGAAGSMTTDEKGVVVFKKLKPLPYFIDARKDDLNNDAEGVQTAPLLEGKTNKVNIVIS